MEVERIGGDLGDKREQTMTEDTFHQNSVDSNHKTATPGITEINEAKTTGSIFIHGDPGGSKGNYQNHQFVRTPVEL